MAKKFKQTVKTPTIDKMVKAAKKHHTKAYVPEQPTPAYVIYQHPVFVLWRMFTQFFVLLPFGLILLFFPTEAISSTEIRLLQLCFLFFVINTILGSYVYWRLNVALVFPETLQLFFFKNMLRQRHESFELGRLNTFDLSRKGLLSYVFNYADLNLSTIVKEVESTDKLTIHRARRPEQVLKILKYYASK